MARSSNVVHTIHGTFRPGEPALPKGPRMVILNGKSYVHGSDEHKSALAASKRKGKDSLSSASDESDSSTQAKKSSKQKEKGFCQSCLESILSFLKKYLCFCCFSKEKKNDDSEESSSATAQEPKFLVMSTKNISGYLKNFNGIFTIKVGSKQIFRRYFS